MAQLRQSRFSPALLRGQAVNTEKAALPTSSSANQQFSQAAVQPSSSAAQQQCSQSAVEPISS
eukprot:363689-Chlamydomonas_euryale.AAC.5